MECCFICLKYYKAGGKFARWLMEHQMDRIRIFAIPYCCITVAHVYTACILYWFKYRGLYRGWMVSYVSARACWLWPFPCFFAAATVGLVWRARPSATSRFRHVPCGPQPTARPACFAFLSTHPRPMPPCQNYIHQSRSAPLWPPR
jgi:hypothetical protein